MLKIIEINKHQTQFRFPFSTRKFIYQIFDPTVKTFPVVNSGELVSDCCEVKFIVHLVYFIICVQTVQRIFYLAE